jgi:branched-chain amino acid transport system permease protein
MEKHGAPKTHGLVIDWAARYDVLAWLLTRTRFGAQIRASVDNQQAAAGLGVNVDRVFSLTFALGSGLAGLGGGLGIDVLGLEPTFPLKYMVYFLLVVAVGGAGTITGPLVAALILGVFDVAGKYYVPALGAFMVYIVMIAVLVLRPHGLFFPPSPGGSSDSSISTNAA